MIVVLMNVRDLLHSTKAAVEFFHTIPDAFVILADNASTYPPLLDWYNKGCPLGDQSPVGDQISPQYEWGFHKETGEMLSMMRDHFWCVLLNHNAGPRGVESILPWWEKVYGPCKYFFYAEPDVDYSSLSNRIGLEYQPNTPKNFLKTLVSGLEAHPEVQGAGLSLRIDDLPDNEQTQYTLLHEKPNWQNPIDPDWFSAPVDCAGVLRRRNWGGSYTGIRSRHLIVRHLPWYHDSSNRPEDFQYYLDHANPSGTFYTARTLDPKHQ